LPGIPSITPKPQNPSFFNVIYLLIINKMKNGGAKKPAEAEEEK
jgi:hypothetical protein